MMSKDMTNIGLAMVSLSVLGLVTFIWMLNVAESKTYWENVGPNWDRMLNPCKYYSGIMPLEGECK